MKKIIIILTVSIILVLIMVAFKTTERIIEDKKQKELAGNQRNNEGDNEQSLPTLKPGVSESTSETGGTNGGTGGGKSSSSVQENASLPSDINTQPCSFYFSEYGVCAGICPTGTCNHIGKSCYCVLS